MPSRSATRAFGRRVLRAVPPAQIALVVADNPGKWPIIEEITTDFMYVRLHGHDELYTSGYSDESLDEWAAKINCWTEPAKTSTSTATTTRRSERRTTRWG